MILTSALVVAGAAVQASLPPAPGGPVSPAPVSPAARAGHRAAEGSLAAEARKRFVLDPALATAAR